MLEMIKETLTNSLSIFTWRDVIDILLVTVIVYQVLLLTRHTRATYLLRGLLAILILSALTTWIGLSAVSWILSRALYAGSILIIVVFQPELRRGLEHLGRQRWNKGENGLGPLLPRDEETVNAIVTAMENMANRKIGALIVMPRHMDLKEIIDTGTRISGLVSAPLIEQIFEPNTPLHDGAMILMGDEIISAGCILPLTDKIVSHELGTRHRAAIGVSESTDCLVLIVSEETGYISTAEKGMLDRDISVAQLREALIKEYYQGDVQQNSWWKLWKKKEK